MAAAKRKVPPEAVTRSAEPLPTPPPAVWPEGPTEAPTPAEPPELAALRSQLEAKEAEAKELLARLKRLQADFENLKKRTQREIAEGVEEGIARVLRGLLETVDLFELALRDAERQADPLRLREGFSLLHRSFLEFLTDAGIAEIPTQGRLDPFLHEAVQQVEGSEGDEGTILTCLQKGYTFNGRVLRPAKVAVRVRSAHPQPEASPAPSESRSDPEE